MISTPGGHTSKGSISRKIQRPTPKAPAMQPWGLRVAYVFDPSGVLWHIAGTARWSATRLARSSLWKVRIQRINLLHANVAHTQNRVIRSQTAPPAKASQRQLASLGQIDNMLQPSVVQTYPVDG